MFPQVASVLLQFAGAAFRPPLYDGVTLNIGVNCHWERQCMERQQRAMRNAIKYVSKYHPPPSRIQQCNRNASRGRGRVDWVGFNNCVRNPRILSNPRQVGGRHEPSRWR